MNWKPYPFTIIILLLIGTAPVGAEETLASTDSQIKAFQLYVDCKPVHVLIKTLPPNAEKIGLTKAQIMTAVEARLRGARIFSEDLKEPFFLYIAVNVVGEAFHAHVSMNKVVKDYRYSQQVYSTQTWLSGGTGTHDQNSEYILSSILEFVDKFIVEYSWVNHDACNQKP